MAAPTTIHRVDPILGDCSLERLRARTSYKWRTYPADVLPAFVAEMDFDPAEPIKDAIRAAVAAGDLGYPHVGDLGAAFADFAADRLGGWSPDPDLIFAIPDVMTGIAEVIQAITGPAPLASSSTPRCTRRSSSGSSSLATGSSRRRSAPRTATMTWTWTRSTGRSARPALALTCCAIRTTRSAGSGHATS